MEHAMVLVVYNCSIDDEMMEALEKAGMRHYTKFVGIRGAGEKSDPRLNTRVWPGTNSMLLVCVPAEDKDRLLEGVRQMKGAHEQEGVKAFVLPIVTCL